MQVLENLGRYFGEKELQIFLNELELKTAPKIKRDEVNTYLSNSKLGIELTFTREGSLDVQSREYPEGALVLSNIRFYGIKTQAFNQWTMQLPHDVAFGETKDALLKRFGKPTKDNLTLKQIRWDKADHAVFAKLGDDSRLEIFGLQLPIVPA